ncbi:hypothetical protein K6U06_06015 [Acidiferrimicrobium sp. IK]|uniref:hypothetical protein n=1 Tax=Acidiferrimicrobium sp. IK TaxID=2871700 RepID=UPI0021CB6F3F|nr:hypothetical protein [Acidiferrimicrobium sp. IK]MCU4183909.1 hypothetical protein [Acidiferrimicrobium sp. IK]
MRGALWVRRLAAGAACSSAMVGIVGMASATPAVGQTAVTTPLSVPVPATPQSTTPLSAPPSTEPGTVPSTTPTSATVRTSLPPAPAPTTPYRAPANAAGTYTSTPQSTSVAPGTTTTVVPIKGRIPSAPSTVPFVTKAQSAHVNPILAKISLAGLALALLIMAVQFVLTRPGREGRRTL